MKKIEPRRLKGFRDYPPALMALRNAVIDVVRQEAALAGFQAIGTPALEYAETLLGQGGEETDKQTYRFKDNGDRDVALRFDLTVPFARFVAEHQGELAFPFKKLQIGDVWRGENTQKGRYREFCQCDLDVIGVDTAAADAETLGVFQRILRRIDCGPFTMRVGNRKILSALIKHFVPEHDETKVLIAIDRLEKAPDALTKLGVAREQDLLAVLRGGLAKAREALSAQDDVIKECARLEQTVALAGGSARVDLTIARGLGYYTGIVFETTLDDPKLQGFGSVSSGGRYNDLASRFTTRELPGVGGSVGLDRLVAAMEELGKVQEKKGSGPVFIAVAGDDALAHAMQLAADLRSAGVPTDVGMVPKLSNQFKHADRLGSPYVIVVGATEIQSGEYSVKKLADGSEAKVKRGDLTNFVSRPQR